MNHYHPSTFSIAIFSSFSVCDAYQTPLVLAFVQKMRHVPCIHLKRQMVCYTALFILLLLFYMSRDETLSLIRECTGQKYYHNLLSVIDWDSFGQNKEHKKFVWMRFFCFSVTTLSDDEHLKTGLTIWLGLSFDFALY